MALAPEQRRRLALVAIPLMLLSTGVSLYLWHSEGQAVRHGFTAGITLTAALVIYWINVRPRRARRAN